MAWERRGSRHYLYWYGGRRPCGSVIKHFVGGGAIVAGIAEEDFQRRAEVRTRRDEESKQREVILALVRRTLVAERALRRTLAREMARQGFHQHDRGEWRRARRKVQMVQQTRRRLATKLPQARTDDQSGQLSEKARLFTNRALNGWLDLASQGDDVLRSQLEQHIAAQRISFAEAGNSPVELLLIERVPTCTMETEFFDVTRANSRGISLRQGRFLELRQAGAERRLTAALRTLATVRDLLRQNRQR